MATDPLIPSTESLMRNSQSSSELAYPLELKTDFRENRPIIAFKCNPRNVSESTRYACFPIPQGLDFSDGASYDDSSLGVVGSAVSALASNIASNGITDFAKSLTVEGAIDRLKNNLGNPGLASMGIQAINNMPGLSQQVKSGIGIAMKMTVNPHVTTEFTGVGTRSYGFKFKLIGSTKPESDEIKNICELFRRGLYPEADILALKYPPTWTVRFLSNGADIEYLPKIWECYLTSLNVSYNGSTNLWHEDGSPIECDISVSFKETRSLTYNDIIALEKNDFDKIPKGTQPKGFINQVTINQNEVLPTTT